MGLVSFERDGRVAFLTLNRPQKANGLTMELLRELVSRCSELREDGDVALVVLRGSGGIFSAGADLMSFIEAFQGDDPNCAADLGRVAAEALATLPQLTVAAIDGLCVGGGVVLTAACDLRWATTRSWFSLPETEIGIPLGWGALPRLVDLVGESAAVDLVISCRRIGAEEARSLGLIARVFEDGDTLAAEVEALRARPALVLRTTKQQLRSIRSGSYDAKGDAALLLRSLQDAETLEIAMRYMTDRDD